MASDFCLFVDNKDSPASAQFNPKYLLLLRNVHSRQSDTVYLWKNLFHKSIRFFGSCLSFLHSSQYERLHALDLRPGSWYRGSRLVMPVCWFCSTHVQTNDVCVHVRVYAHAHVCVCFGRNIPVFQCTAPTTAWGGTSICVFLPNLILNIYHAIHPGWNKLLAKCYCLWNM